MTRLLIRVGVIVAMALTTVTAQQRTGPAPEPVRPPALADHRSRGQPLLAPSPASPATRTRTTSASASGGIWKTTDGGIHWDADLRRPAGAVDRRARRRAIGSERGLGRHRRGRTSAATSRSGRASTSRTDAGKTWTRMGLEPTGRIARIVDRPDESGHRARRARSATPTGRSRSAACSARPTAARPGARAVRRREHRLLGPRDGSEEPAHRSSPACGSSRSTRGAARAAGRAAGSSCRATAARRGRGCAGNGLPTQPVGKVALAIAPSNPNRVYAHDRDRRRRAVEGQADRPRPAVALGRRRRHLAAWSSYDRNVDGPRPLLLAHGGRAGQRERDVLPRPRRYAQDRIDGGADARARSQRRRRVAGRRPPRHLDRSDQRRTA